MRPLTQLLWDLVGTSLLLAAPLATADRAVSFEKDVAPLFARECAACHLKEGPVAGLILEPRFAHAMIVGVPSMGSALKRVEPGRPDRSYLLLKMEDRHREAGGSGDRMPPGWLFLTAQEIDLVRRWIRQGAPSH